MTDPVSAASGEPEVNTTALFDEYSRVCAERDTLAQQRDAAVRRADKLERRASKQGQEIASLKRSLDRKETATPEASTKTEDVLREYHLGYNDSRGHVFRVEDMAMDFATLRARLEACEEENKALVHSNTRLREMVEAYGVVQQRTETERNLLELRFRVSQEVLRRAHNPMEVFAHSVDNCLRQYREWMFTNIPRYREYRRTQEIATAMADAMRLRSALTATLDDDDGPNDGHARTVRRSAKQDAGQNDDTDWDYTTPPQDAATQENEL